MTTLLIGCPVAHRTWIIRHWADYALRSARHAGFEPSFLVAAHPDDPTPAHLAASLGSVLDVVDVDVARHEDRRTWNKVRFGEMAAIRNRLLRRVREIEPDLFLSVDSDILLHPEAIDVMVGMLNDYDAAGTACFLSAPPAIRADGATARPAWSMPNYAKLDRAERIMRTWTPNLTRRVDVLMAIKMMTPAAYLVDYRPHHQGEDIGWGIGARGLRLGWSSKVVSKHVMRSHCGLHDQHDAGCAQCLEPISRVDPRCGY